MVINLNMENRRIPNMSQQAEDKPQVMHVISGLHVGGAETMLYRLLSQSSLQKNSVVISLSSGGELTEKIRQLGVEVIELPRGSLFSTLKRLAEQVQLYKPNVLQSWLYRADLLTSWVAWRARIPLIWNVRQTEVAMVAQQSHIWWAQRMAVYVSKWLPKKIIYCAQAAKNSHEHIGYKQSKGMVINNGVDTQHFSMDESLRRAQRQDLGVLNDEMLVGMVGRFDPLKNHARFLRVLRDVIKQCPKQTVKGVLVGRGINIENDELMELIQRYDLVGKIELIEEVDNIQPLYCALDVHVLTSDSEGWPNVLAEAMSVGLPCVATDVGDVSGILSDRSEVINRNNETQIAKKVVEFVQLPKSERWKIGKLNREKIQQNSSLQSAVERYDDLYLNIAE